ncbi:MAG: biotin-independent malonate decarboxylase subunit gamma, partial [Casimicrobiaceae bacterium]
QQHARKMSAAVARARAARRTLLVLAASGGVRLHEANAAELGLARVLRELIDARAAGIRTLAVGIGDVFGGMSIVAAACDALALAPAVRFGVSGPQVVAMSHPGTLVAADRARVDTVFGAAARVRAGFALRVDDNPAAIRAWLHAQPASAPSLADSVREAQQRIAPASERFRDNEMVAVSGERATLRAFAGEVDATLLGAVDAQLLALPAAVRTLLIIEHSRGHAATVDAEMGGLSWRLAHHACVLGVLRVRGVAIVGIVDGIGHSAAFFANALQADRLFALPGARIVAMEPQAISRVTGMDAALLAAAIEDDPLLGHPARHMAALGGLTLVPMLDAAR